MWLTRPTPQNLQGEATVFEKTRVRGARNRVAKSFSSGGEWERSTPDNVTLSFEILDE